MLLNGTVGKIGDNISCNEAFLREITSAIVQKRKRTRAPSSSYSPSGMNCIRQMYYKRRKVVPEQDTTVYTDVGMADTGTSRHETIQEVLVWMTQHGSRFKYIDVDRYIEEKQKRGKLLNIVVEGKSGAETKLHDSKRDIRFRCDGIIYDSRTKEFYLFEFKNQISSSAVGKACVDMKHHCQVDCYGALLDLNKAFVLYENRDTCQLYLPEIYEIKEYNKLSILKKIDDCEYAARHGVVPDKPTNLSPSDCRWCQYKKQCKLDSK